MKRARLCRVWLTAILLALLSIGSGCQKKMEPLPALNSQSFPDLPEATNIVAALEQKDYETAVSSLAKLKESVSTEAQQKEYALLTAHVQNKLTEALPTDPKAAEAMQALRVIIAGR